MTVSPTRILASAVLAASLGVPLAVSAQQAPPPGAPPAPAGAPAPAHHGGHFMKALRTLNLSDAQKQQIQTVFQQTRQANQNADPATRKANMQQLRSQIDGILTPDQRARLQAEIAKERAARANGSAPGSTPPPRA